MLTLIEMDYMYSCDRFDIKRIATTNFCLLISVNKNFCFSQTISASAFP